MSGQKLVIDFVGETYPLEPGDSLEFGRNAQLVIDENRYLHVVSADSSAAIASGCCAILVALYISR